VAEYKHAMEAAKYYFERAIKKGKHFGAHYSLALMLKLHPFLLGDTYDFDNNAMDGEEHGLAHVAYAHMCQSQIECVRERSERRRAYASARE
jgi:hypothetical protein